VVAKYRNKISLDADGVPFASKRELTRWRELVLLQTAGLISELRRQVRLPLGVKYDSGREAALVVDFMYVEKGEQKYADAKGFETDASKLKRAILRSRGIEIVLV